MRARGPAAALAASPLFLLALTSGATLTVMPLAKNPSGVMTRYPSGAADAEMLKLHTKLNSASQGWKRRLVVTGLPW
jgi:hypothetical protein